MPIKQQSPPSWLTCPVKTHFTPVWKELQLVVIVSIKKVTVSSKMTVTWLLKQFFHLRFGFSLAFLEPCRRLERQ
jgi:hypothetical protein